MLRSSSIRSDSVKPMERLEQQTNHYLQRKMNQRGATDAQDLLSKANGEYERKRIEYALKLQAAVAAYKGLDKPTAGAERAGLSWRPGFSPESCESRRPKKESGSKTTDLGKNNTREGFARP